jgi:hypothetical protein
LKSRFTLSDIGYLVLTKSSELLSDDEDDDEDMDSDEERARRKARMDALVAPLEPGEYGKMPPEYRHGNSQTTATAIDETESSAPTSKPTTTADTLSRPIRRPIFQRDKFDGVDSDDETTDEEEGGPLEEGEEDEEDRPQVVGEVEIDMDQEQEDFIRFSRELLGIDDDAWANIIADREKRGGRYSFIKILLPCQTDSVKVYIPPSAKISREEGTLEKEKAPKGPNAAQFFDEIPKIAVTQRPTRKRGGDETKKDDPNRIPNPDLDSFEAVMDAMEKVLAKLKNPPPSSSTKQPSRDIKGKGKAKEVQIPPRPKSKPSTAHIEEVDMDEDDEDVDMDELQRAMDLELRSALKRDAEVVSSGEEDEGDEDEEMPMDYNLIKNFLESFKAQQGLSGPVGGLAGRLQGSDWALPRDS